MKGRGTSAVTAARRAAVVTVVAVIAAGFAVDVPAAALAATPAVTDIPVGDRAQPREADVLSVSDEGMVYLREGDDPGALPSTLVSVRWRSADGSVDDDLDASPGVHAVGSRLLYPPRYAAPATSISTRTVATPWTHFAIPTGDDYLAATEDGVLVRGGTDQLPTVSLLPWDGGAAVPVSGLPADADPGQLNPLLESITVADAHGALIATGGPLNESVAYVDTSAATAWALPDDAGTSYSLASATIAWIHGAGGADPQIGTIARPAAGAATDAMALRPLPISTCGPGECTLVPVADAVLVQQKADYQQYYALAPAQVLAVAPDGSVSTAQQWAHNVVPAPNGGYVAVVGADPDAAAILAVTPDGAASTVVSLPPVPAAVSSLAVDGNRVVTVSDATGGAVATRTLTGDPAQPVSAATAVANAAVAYGSCTARPCGYVAVDGDTIAWRADSDKTGVLTAGVTMTPYDDADVYAIADFRSLSGTWAVMGDDLSANRLVDLTTGRIALRAPWATDGPPSWMTVADGVLYTPDRFDGTTVVGRVLTPAGPTGATETVWRPGCGPVNDIHVAGSWLLARCGSSQALLDRTTGTQRTLTDPVWLTDGAVVRMAADGELEWSPLTDSLDWQPVGGTAATTMLGFTPSTENVAVSRHGAAVAWIDSQHRAHVATLPVSPSPTPALPTGPSTAPQPPNVAVTDVGNGTVSLAWAPPAVADEVRRWTINSRLAGTNTVVAHTSVAGDATTGTIAGLDDGKTYSLTLTASNNAGDADSQPVTAIPQADPPLAPTDVTASVDKLTSTVTLHWLQPTDPGFRPVSSYRLDTLSGIVSGIPAGTRSITVAAHGTGGWGGILWAVSDRGEAPAGIPSIDVPGDDRTPPTVTTAAVPPVTLGSSVVVRFGATDDRRVADYSIGWRYAAAGKPLGALTHPSQWQHLTASSLTVPNLRPGWTYCFTVTARDLAGNLSTRSAGCAVRPLDDRAVARSTAGWSRVTGDRYYLGTATTTRAFGRTLMLRGMRADALSIVATRCATCGAIDIYVGSQLVAKVSLRHSTTQRHAVITVPWDIRRSGTLRLTTTTRATVAIDGLALRSY